MPTVPAPLFRDPIFDGAADPTIVWNHGEGAWWLFYTNRRTNVDAPGFAWVHGTDIGIASSTDGGNTWVYRGLRRADDATPAPCGVLQNAGAGVNAC